MSTIKSSAEHLTLNADGASRDIKFQANGVEKASISSAGLFTSTTIDATKLTGNLPAISGASLTNLPAGGKVLQVVHASYGTKVSSTSSTHADTGLTASITPASTSNKILVSYTLSGVIKESGNTNIGIKLVRGTSAIWQSEQWTLHTSDSTQQRGSFSGVWLDSPSSTSSTAYKVTFSNSENVNTVSVQNDNGTTTSSMVLMEIAG